MSGVSLEVDATTSKAVRFRTSGSLSPPIECTDNHLRKSVPRTVPKYEISEWVTVDQSRETLVQHSAQQSDRLGVVGSI